MQDIPYGYCHCGCGRRTNLRRDNDAPRGYVKGEPNPYVLGHNRGKLAAAPYVEEDRGHKTPCWIWQLSIQDNGYGHIGRPGKYNGTAHKWYWMQRHGRPPAGAQLDHLCEVYACCNPDHLELVTAAENTRRSRVTKLTYEDVRTIRALRASGYTQKEAGALFGVRRQTISDIDRGATWVAEGGTVHSAT